MRKEIAVVIGLLAVALPSLAQQAMPLEQSVTPPFRTGNTAVGTASLTPGQMSALLTGTPVAAASYTTPTATQICQLFPSQSSAAANLHYDWYVNNTSGGANTITIVGGAGVTVTGTATIVQANIKHFMVVLDNCVAGAQAVHVISLGTSVF